VNVPVDVPSSIDPLDLVEPTRFAQHGYPHELWTALRAQMPVAYLEPPGFMPFWAITKHADIIEIAAQPERFSSAQGLILGRPGAPAQPSEMWSCSTPRATAPASGGDATVHPPEHPVAPRRDRPYRGGGPRRPGRLQPDR